ncbi:MAG: hypothetical protein HY807_08585 [Nitrospirae bacterium]|nr:hypothetical protein [Nitrospirota bacterium]
MTRKFLYLFFAVTIISGLLISGCGNNNTVDEIVKRLLGGAIQGQALTLEGVVTTFAGSPNQVGSADGVGAGPRFNRPYDITTDGTNLYVTDRDNHTIRQIVIDTGVITTLAGTAGSSGTADGTGAAARFNQPTGITTDGTNLYVAEKENHTIRKIVIATGVVTTLAGTAGTSGTTDGTGTAALFNQPRGLVTNGTNLYVTDWNNHTIRKIVIATGVVTTFAGTAGTSGAADGTGAAATFNQPRGITSDGANLYVADYWNHTIRKIAIATAAVTTIAGDAGVTGFADGTGTDATFEEPSGITTEGTSLYVTDNANETIRKID